MGDPLLLPQGPEWANCLTSQSHQDLSAGIPPRSPAPPTCFLLILTLSSRAWKPHSGLDSLLGIIPNSFPLILTSFLLIIPAWQYPTPVEPRYPLMPHPSSSKQFQRKTTQLFGRSFLNGPLTMPACPLFYFSILELVQISSAISCPLSLSFVLPPLCPPPLSSLKTETEGAPGVWPLSPPSHSVPSL